MQLDAEVRAKIQVYLRSVAVNLEGMSPGEKEELLGNLESHIHEALAARAADAPTLDDLQAVLTEMAPSESYAEEPADTPRAMPPAAPAQGGLGKWALGLAVAGIVAAGAIAAGGAIWSTSGSGLETSVGIAFILGAGLEILALILGIRNRREQAGRTAAWISGSVMVLIAIALLTLALVFGDAFNQPVRFPDPPPKVTDLQTRSNLLPVEPPADPEQDAPQTRPGE